VNDLLLGGGRCLLCQSAAARRTWPPC